MRGLVLFENGGVREVPVDVVFPVLHGKNGEDGTVQGLLEMAGVPYVGCGVLGSALCMDKAAANFVMDAAGIDRCEWMYMERWQRGDFDAIERKAAEKLGYPMFVKPANAGSSVGISKAHDKAQLAAAVDLALRHDSRVVLERFVRGQEVECAVRGNGDVHSTRPGEILASAEFYTYDDKYVSGTSRTAIPAHLPADVLDKVARTAERAYACCAAAALRASTSSSRRARGASCSTRSTPCGLHLHQHVPQADDRRGRELRAAAGQPDRPGAGGEERMTAPDQKRAHRGVRLRRGRADGRA